MKMLLGRNRARKVVSIFIAGAACLLMHGCGGQKTFVYVKMSIEVFESPPKQIDSPEVKSLGFIQEGEAYELQSTEYGNDFAIYEIDLPDDQYQAHSGYIYHDSRMLEPRKQ